MSIKLYGAHFAIGYSRTYSSALLLTERYLGQYCFLLTERLLSVNIVIEVVAVGFFFSAVRLARATAKSSNSIIFKFLVLIQQY